jgi:hypothetical protein
MKKLFLGFGLLFALTSSAFAQQLNNFRYGGATVISASTYVSALVAPAVAGQQNIVTHWFAEPVSGTIVSFWTSPSNSCTPVGFSGVTSLTISNNTPIMDGSGNGALFAAPSGQAICIQAVTAGIPGLVTYGISP